MKSPTEVKYARLKSSMSTMTDMFSYIHSEFPRI